MKLPRWVKVSLFLFVVIFLVLTFTGDTLFKWISGPEEMLADDKVVLYEPLPNASVRSPLLVRGKARGPWFFEASFPVTLTDRDGRILSQLPAQAKGDWMTTDWVEFEATLIFNKPTYTGEQSNRGTLILRKDNPSGLPQFDDSREITVYFK